MFERLARTISEVNYHDQLARERRIAKVLGIRHVPLRMLIERVYPVQERLLTDGSTPEGPAAAWLERQGYLQRIGTQRRAGSDVPVRIVTETGLALVAKAKEMGW